MPATGTDPEVTRAERFMPEPFAPDSRLYKTGSGPLPAGWDHRIPWPHDNQVKLRGFRVELGEIEAALRSHPSVREAVAIVHGEQQKLAAYLVAKGKRAPSAAELGRLRSIEASEHMVPSTYAVLESMPTLPSGKINRRALLAVHGCLRRTMFT